MRRDPHRKVEYSYSIITEAGEKFLQRVASSESLLVFIANSSNEVSPVSYIRYISHIWKVRPKVESREVSRRWLELAVKSFAAGFGDFEYFGSAFGYGRDVVGRAVVDQFGGVGWGRLICVRR